MGWSSLNAGTDSGQETRRLKVADGRRMDGGRRLREIPGAKTPGGPLDPPAARPGEEDLFHPVGSELAPKRVQSDPE